MGSVSSWDCEKQSLEVAAASLSSVGGPSHESKNQLVQAACVYPGKSRYS